MAELSVKQRLFVSEYLKDKNATQAAIRAGYSANGAEVQGHRLLRMVKIAAAVEKSLQKVLDRNELTQDKVVQELMLLGFANMADYMREGPDGTPYVDFTAMTREKAAALQEVTVDTFVEGKGEDARTVKRIKFKLYDKRATLIDLGKHLGMFKDHKVLEFDQENPFTAIVRKCTEQPDIPPGAVNSSV